MYCIEIFDKRGNIWGWWKMHHGWCPSRKQIRADLRAYQKLYSGTDVKFRIGRTRDLARYHPNDYPVYRKIRAYNKL